MRPPLLALLVTVAALGAVVAMAPAQERGPDGTVRLLPDLQQEVPGKVSVVRRGRTQRLIFRSAVRNVGRGTLYLDASRPDRETRTMGVTQLIDVYDRAGQPAPQAVVEDVGRARFFDVRTHHHWHIMGFERYELRRLDGRLAARDRKTGFCVGARYLASPARARSARAPVRWTDLDDDCGQGEPGALRILSGLTPGYGDDYEPEVEGQFIDVTRVRPGRYQLIHRTNVDRAIREAGYVNNAASVLLELRRSGRRMTARVLRRCPDSAVCRPGRS